MRGDSSVLFQLKLYMIWTKAAHQSAKLQTFDCSREILPNLYFHWLRLLKVYKISAKKVQRSYVSWHWRWCNIWRKTDLLFQKWQKFGEFWPKHSKVSKICTLTGSFCAKYKTFDIKKYRGVILHDTEEWCKISRKTDLWFGKWLGIWQIFTRALESVKIENLVGSFCPKWKMHELKIYRGVMCN